MASSEVTAESPTQAPDVEAGMSRELGVVRDHTNYFLVEDHEWRHKNYHYCEIRRKYTIHTSPRQFTEREVSLSKREVEKFPVIFEVREQGTIYSGDTQVHFGIFPANLPDEPLWPLESPLLQWTQTMEPTESFEEVKVLMSNGEQLGFAQREKQSTYSLHLFDNEGNTLYTLHTPYCENGYKILIYGGKELEKLGFFRKVFRHQCEALWACDCSVHNWNLASLPETSSAEERLMLLKELISQARRLHAFHTLNYC